MLDCTSSGSEHRARCCRLCSDTVARNIPPVTQREMYPIISELLLIEENYDNVAHNEQGRYLKSQFLR